jgi:5'-3' exonuclease
VTKTLLAVDGNSLIHRYYHAPHADLRTSSGRPVWAIRSMLAQILAAAARAQPLGAVVVGFDDPHGSVRRSHYDGYKAGRPAKHEDLVAQLNDAAVFLTQAGIPVISPAGLEADDVLASAAAAAAAAADDWQCLAVSSDKDVFTLVDNTTSVLRIVNGGVDHSPVLTPSSLGDATGGLTADEYADYKALAGDTSDRLPGVAGIGDKLARALIAEFGTADAALNAAANGGYSRVVAVLGKARAARFANPAARDAYDTNAYLMTLHTDVDLGVDLTTGRGCLPLPAEAIDAAVTTFELEAFRGPTLRLLTAGRTPDAADPPPNTPPAVTDRAADPYHCMTCGRPVTPCRTSVERQSQVQCTPCWESEWEAIVERRGRRR